jgi:hypothetical protein
LNALVNLSSRPLSHLTIQARYRYNEHENNTSHFDSREYVRFDGVPEELGDDPLTPRPQRGLRGSIGWAG